MKKITGKCVEIKCGPFYKIPEGYDDVTIRVAHKSMHDTTLGTEVEICYEEPKQFLAEERKIRFCRANDQTRCSKYKPHQLTGCSFWGCGNQCHYKE